MFTTPDVGWSEFNLDGFRDRFSYLTNAPRDCMEAFISIFSRYPREEWPKRGGIVYFDAEGWEYALVLQAYHPCGILRFRGEGPPEWIVLKESCLELAEALANDLEGDLDAWINEWYYNFQGVRGGDDIPDRARLEQGKNDLVTRLERLKQAIAERRSFDREVANLLARTKEADRDAKA